MAEVQADLILSVDQALAQVEELANQITDATSGVVLEVSADTSEASAEIDSVEAAPVEVSVEADVSPAEGEIDSLDAAPIDVEVNVDTAQAQDQLESLNETATETSGSLGSGASGLGGVLAQSGSSGVLAATGYGVAAKGLFELAESYGEAQSVAAVTDQIIANQGDTATTTGSHIRDLSTDILNYAGFSDEAVASSANFLLQLGSIRNEAGEGNNVLDRTLAVSADLARTLGTDFGSAATLLGRALADPERGLGRLERRFGPLDAAVKANIISLAQSGDTLGAQTELLDVLEGKVDGVAEAYGGTFAGQLAIAKEQVGELGEDIGQQLVPALGDLVSQGQLAVGVIESIGGAIGDIPGLGGEGLDTSALTDIAGGPLAQIQRLFEGPGSFGTPVSGSIFGDLFELDDSELLDAAAALGDVETSAEGAGDATQRLGDEWAGLAGRLSATDAEIASEQALYSLRNALAAAQEEGGITGEEMVGLRQDLSRLIATTIEVANAQTDASGAAVTYQQRNANLRSSLAALAAFIPAQLLPQFNAIVGDLRTIDSIDPRITIYTNAAAIRAEYESLIGVINNAGALAASNSPSFHGLTESALVRPAPVANGESTVISVQVDARGARNPQAVGDAVAEALAPHRARRQVRLNQRAGV